jgi:hypothetical protein
MFRIANVVATASMVAACAADHAQPPPPPNYYYGSSVRPGPAMRNKPPAQMAPVVPQPGETAIPSSEVQDHLDRINESVRRERDRMIRAE